MPCRRATASIAMRLPYESSIYSFLLSFTTLYFCSTHVHSTHTRCDPNDFIEQWTCKHVVVDCLSIFIKSFIPTSGRILRAVIFGTMHVNSFPLHNCTTDTKLRIRSQQRIQQQESVHLFLLSLHAFLVRLPMAMVRLCFVTHFIHSSNECQYVNESLNCILFSFRYFRPTYQPTNRRQSEAMWRRYEELNWHIKCFRSGVNKVNLGLKLRVSVPVSVWCFFREPIQWNDLGELQCWCQIDISFHFFFVCSFTISTVRRWIEFKLGTHGKFISSATASSAPMAPYPYPSTTDYSINHIRDADAFNSLSHCVPWVVWRSSGIWFWYYFGFVLDWNGYEFHLLITHFFVSFSIDLPETVNENG